MNEYGSIVVAVLAHGRVVAFYPAVAFRHAHKGIVLPSHEVPRLALQPLDQITPWLCGRPFAQTNTGKGREEREMFPNHGMAHQIKPHPEINSTDNARLW